MRIRLNSLLLVGGLGTAATTLHGQSVNLDSVQAARLAMLGRVWGTAKYFHPAFLSREVPWDSALMATVPRVIAARDAAEYGAAVDGMLHLLGDASTGVRPRATRTFDDANAPVAMTTRWEADSTLIVSIPRFMNDVSARLAAAMPSIRASRRVVFDLRGRTPPVLGEADDEFANGLDALLAGRPMAGPAVRRRVQREFSSPYQTIERPGELFRPALNNAVRRVVFLVFADSDLPAIAWALQGVGQGAIVLDSARGVSMNLESSRSESHAMDIGDGLLADIRVSDVVGKPNGVAAPDTIVSGTASADAPLRAALDLARRPVTMHAGPVVAPVALIPEREETYPQMRNPTLPYRLLAGFRYWNAVRYFYPSEMPIGEDWNRVLLESTRALAAARDSVEYAVAVWDMAARLKDGHAGSQSAAISRLRGESWPAAGVEYVEGQPVVVRIGNDSVIRASGLKVGDIVLKVDGEAVPARRARLAKYSGGTRPEVHEYLFAQNSMLSGPEGSTARVTVRSAGGVVRELSLLRRGRPCTQCPLRPGPAFRVLSGNIGYVDLSLLEEAAVDSMFEMFKHTKAIIFDGRGYPRGTSFSIAPRLSDRDGVPLAKSRRPVWSTPDSTTRGVTTSLWLTDPTTKWRYRGKTVLLIDQHAYSQGEQIALAIGSLGATLIGSPTRGGLGSATSVQLPGGVTAGFPSGESGWPDGRSITRVGIQPNILVRPTIGGIRAARDEVLEGALTFLRACSTVRC